MADDASRHRARHQVISDELQKAHVLTLFKRYDDARAVYLRLLSADARGDFRVPFNFGQLCLQTGQDEDAVALFREALALRPSEQTIAGALSGLLIKRHEPQAAADVCRAALLAHAAAPEPSASSSSASSTTSRAVRYNLNVALRQLGRLDEAVAASWAALAAALPDPTPALLSPLPQPRPPPTTEDTVVFVCVKFGTKYGPEYVNFLHRSVAAWSPPAWRFVCLTEDATGLDAAVDARPLPPSPGSGAGSGALGGWWAKGHLFEAMAAAFAPAGTSGPRGPWVVYCDLDTVVAGDLRFLGDLCRAEDVHDAAAAADEQSEPFITLAAADFISEGRPCGLNSSLMLWRAGAFRGLTSFLLQHPNPDAVPACVHKFDHYLEMMLLAPNAAPLRAPVEAARVVYVQEALRRRHPGAPPTVVDYASLRRRAPAAGEESRDNMDAIVDVDAPAGAAVVCFPLKPKPHEIEHEAPTLFRRWQGQHPCPEPPTF